MSHAILARRLLGAGRLRRTISAAPSSACLASTLERFSIGDHGHGALPRPSLLPCNRSLSSEVRRTADLSGIVEQPLNLKIDPRAKSSPFYGAERVEPKQKKKRGEKKAKRIESGAPAAAAVDEDFQGEKSVREDVVKGSSEAIEDGGDMDEYEDYDSEEEEENEEEEEERILYDLTTKPDIPRAIPLPQRLHVPVMDIRTGEKIGTFHLSERTFGNDPIRVDILHRVVVWQRNRKRGKRNAGARTKTIAEVSGSGRKVRKQKGSGKARAGHSRPAHWRGGAKAHGPKGRVQDYTTKLNRKVRKMGVRHALSQKLKEGNLIVTNDLAMPTHKTKELDIMLQRFGISGKGGSTALVCDAADLDDAEGENNVYGGLDVNFKVASGNLPKVKVLNQKGCMVYSMLKFRKLVLSLAAVQGLEERLERDL